MRPIYEIAADVRKTWRRKDGTPSVYFGAVPYLEAMESLDKITDSYGLVDARGILQYFLSNASTFRGPEAKRIKDEIKAMVK